MPSWTRDVKVERADGFYEVVDIQAKGQSIYTVGNLNDFTAAVQEYSDMQRLSTSSVGHTGQVVATSMSIDKSNGNLYIGGYTELTQQDFMMACLDQTGRVLWFKSFGTNQDDLINGVVVSGDGHLYYSGTLGGTADGFKFKGGTDIILFKYSTNGTEIWRETYGGPGYEMAWSVTMGKTPNDIYVAGFVGFTNGFIQRYDSLGKLVWHDQLSQTSSLSGLTYDHVKDEVYATGYLIGKFDEHVSELVDVLATKWYANGTRAKWSVLIGGRDVDFGFDLAIHPQTRSLFIAGTTYGSIDDIQQSAGGMDNFISKVHPNGTIAWSIQGGSPREDVIGGLAITDDGYVYVCGITDNDYGFIGQLQLESTSEQSVQSVVTGSPVIAILLILLAAVIVAGYAFYKYGERPFQYALGRRIRLDMPWSSNRRIRLDDVYDVDATEENQIMDRK